MSFLKRLGRALAGGSRGDSHALWIYVRCRRCGEAIGTRVDLRNEPSIRYDEGGQPADYHVRKVLVGGKKRCYQPVEVHLIFDANRRLVEREITGGEFITAEEFAAETGTA